jgi:hypothetical protein
VNRTPQRLEDLNLAYQVRPLVVEIDGCRLTISSHEAQLLLGALGRLPSARYGGAEQTATELVHGLAAACVVSLDDDRRRCVLRAIEGIRAQRQLPSGLTLLRRQLLHARARIL